MTEVPGSPLCPRAVEDAAILWVLDYERRSGRSPRDTRNRGEAADIQSDERVIEVKATGGSARGWFIWMEPRQIDEARSNPNFHLYIVDNVRQGNPELFRLVDLHGDELAALVAHAREKKHYEVPFPTSVYDRLS